MNPWVCLPRHKIVVSVFRFITTPIANRFRETVSGASDGVPPWARAMSEGHDAGLFGPDSAVWEVHGSVSTLVGGIRALLLQAAHPATPPVLLRVSDAKHLPFGDGPISNTVKFFEKHLRNQPEELSSQTIKND